MIELHLTEREADLIEVALESAISACVGFGLPSDTGTNALAVEYRLTLQKVQQR